MVTFLDEATGGEETIDVGHGSAVYILFKEIP
jgi:hypothetical protein